MHDGLRVDGLGGGGKQGGCDVVVKHWRNAAVVGQLMFYAHRRENLFHQLGKETLHIAPDANIGRAHGAGQAASLWNGIGRVARIHLAKDQNGAGARINPAREQRG